MRTLDLLDSPAASASAGSARYGAAASTPQSTESDAFIGDPVYSHKGEYLGLVMEIMLDMESEKYSHAVVSQGKAFHESGSMVAVPWTALTQSDDGNRRFTLRVDKTCFDAVSGFNYDNWPDMNDAAWSPHVFMQDVGGAWRLL